VPHHLSTHTFSWIGGHASAFALRATADKSLCPPYGTVIRVVPLPAPAACRCSRKAPSPSTGTSATASVCLAIRCRAPTSPVERHQFLEEAARPQHGIAAAAVADGNDDEIAAVRRKALDKTVDQAGIDQRHVAETDHGAVVALRHGRDAGLDRARDAAGENPDS